jgi:hypothetical protein
MRTIEQLIRDVNPIDPRNIHHPSHDEAWLDLMRELGRIAAAEEWERLHGDRHEGSDCLRPLLNRPTKRTVY